MINTDNLILDRPGEQLELTSIVVIAPDSRGMQPDSPAPYILDSLMRHAANSWGNSYEIGPVPLVHRVFGKQE